MWCGRIGYGLHAHVQMARELGMNPTKLGKLDNHKQEPWKMPLKDFIEDRRDLAHNDGRGAAFSARMEKLSVEHTRKPSLMSRFREANLLK